MTRPMVATRRSDTVYEVNSATSNRSYIVSHGTEGPFWSCTCTDYAIKRNRAGGLGNAAICKHVEVVEAQYDLDLGEYEKRQAAEEAKRKKADAKKLKQLERTFLDLEKSLRQ